MAPLSHSLGGPAQIRILCIARPELPACEQHTQNSTDSFQPGKESSRCSQAWRQHSRGSEPLRGFSVGKQNGTRKGAGTSSPEQQLFPQQASRPRTDPALLHRWAPGKHRVASRLQIVPKPRITCYMQTLLPLVWSLLGVGTSGLACHQVERSQISATK